jgi:predicted nucleotidyltransferase component of viral defense system
VTLSAQQLQRAAADDGFQVESYEKAYMLIRLLDAVRAHPFLSARLALKGGTALNLFILDLPRLSVDIDLNYVGTSDRAMMLAERPSVEQALEQVCGRLQLAVKRVPPDHAGGKWRLSYTTALGRPGNLELDVNFLLRTPMWPAAARDSRSIGGQMAERVLVLDVHELAAGKLAALLARSASRDLFDARALLGHPALDRAMLRLGFVVYGGMNREDWRSVTVDRVTTTPRDVDSQLVPMLRQDVRPQKGQVGDWTTKLVRETRERMSAVLPLEDHEREFLERLNGAGDIIPELLTPDPVMQGLIREHPGLTWKALNVKQHRQGAADKERPA